MGLIELMESDDLWQMFITFNSADKKWRAELVNFGGFDTPTYRGIANNMLGAITDIDWNIRQNNKAQEA